MKIAYDMKLKQPGCPLLQAALGCEANVAPIPSEHWLIFPTDDLKVYEITNEQFEKLVASYA